MVRKIKSGRYQLNLYNELKDILNEYNKELYESKEDALDKASDYLLDKFRDASPVRTGTFKNSWTRTDKYKSVRYIGNTTTAKGSTIPIANLIEFSSKGHPFIRKTFEENKDYVVKIIKGGLEDGK